MVRVKGLTSKDLERDLYLVYPKLHREVDALPDRHIWEKIVKRRVKFKGKPRMNKVLSQWCLTVAHEYCTFSFVNIFGEDAVCQCACHEKKTPSKKQESEVA